MSVVTTLFSSLANLSGWTHGGSGSTALSGGKLATTGLTINQIGSETYDATAAATLMRVLAKLELIGVRSGFTERAGGVVLKYSLAGALGWQGVRVLADYAVDSHSLSLVLDVANAAGSIYSNSWAVTLGGALASGAELDIEVEFYLSGTTPKVRGRAWRGADATPGWLFDQIVAGAGASINSIAGAAGVIDKAGSADANTKYRSLLADGNYVVAPSTPTVTVSSIRKNDAQLTGNAFASIDSSATHAYTKVRVRRASDSSVLYGPVTVTRPTLVGPHPATGLPTGPSGPRWEPIVDADYVGELLYGDSNGSESAWGASADFQTLGLWESTEFDVHVRLRVANGSGTLIDLQGRFKGYHIEEPNPNSPIGALNIDLIRELANKTASLAPLNQASSYNRLDDGVTYSPLLLIGRLVTFDAALTEPLAARPIDASLLWSEMFRGRITKINWPTKFSHSASFSCNDLAGALQLTPSEAEYTYTAGTSIEDAIQQTFDNNGFSSVVLSCPVPTGKVLALDHKPGLQKKVWEQAWALAQSIGWLLWYEYSDATTLAVTLFQPERDKVTPDYTCPYYDFNDLSVDEEEIRNVGYLVLTDENGERQTIGPAEDATSIATYGGIRRAFWISLDEDSPVRSVVDGTALLGEALSDTVDPDMISAAPVPFMVFVRAGYHLLTFPASDEFFDTAQHLAPFAVSHEGRPDEQPVTTLQLRGRPSAGAKTWTGKASDQPPPAISDNGVSQAGALLTVTPVFNASVTSWKAWDKVGSSSKTGGVPDDAYAMTPQNLREVASATWSVRDGDHYVLIRAFAADGSYVDREETFAVTGVGGGGTGGGGGTAPTDIPGTPFLTLGALSGGGNQDLEADWANTNSVVDSEGQWSVDGTDGAWFGLGPGATSASDSFVIGRRVRFRVRYTQGAGLEGTPSSWSARMLISGMV